MTPGTSHAKIGTFSHCCRIPSGTPKVWFLMNVISKPKSNAFPLVACAFLLWHYLENVQLLLSTYQVAGLSPERDSKNSWETTSQQLTSPKSSLNTKWGCWLSTSNDSLFVIWAPQQAVMASDRRLELRTVCAERRLRVYKRAREAFSPETAMRGTRAPLPVRKWDKVEKTGPGSAVITWDGEGNLRIQCLYFWNPNSKYLLYK